MFETLVREMMEFFLVASGAAMFSLVIATVVVAFSEKCK